MAVYAVVEDGSKQYRVQKGMTVELEKKPLEVGAEFEFDRVLLTSDGEHVSVGRPLVAGAKVVGKVVDQIRGPKLIGFMYKRRANMHRKFGHRQRYTCVEIQDIVPPSAT